MSVESLITQHIDIWTSAVQTKSTAGRGTSSKLDLYGIKKLRELIFELASKGNLVDSVNNHYEYLENLVELVMGQAPPGLECNKDGIGTIFVKTGEFGNLYPEVREWTTKPLKFSHDGDVLICVVGATIGKLNLGIDCAIGRSVAAIRPDHTKLDSKFLYYSLHPFTNRIRNESKGSAQGVIGKAVLNKVKIRVPSIEEQHRIVAKVDELMKLCDQLEQQTEVSIAAHQVLVETLLATLTNSSNAEELMENWERISAHFDTLFTTEESIDQLKQTILQLAVMGKLVPQNPADEPPTLLLDRIQKHQLSRIKNKEIQKPKKIIPSDELDLDIPNNWQSILLNNLVFVTKLAGFEYTKYINLKDAGEIPVIRAQNVRPFSPSLENLKYIDTETSLSLPRSALDRPALLVTFIGAGIGDVCVFDKNERWHLAPNVAKVEPFADLNLSYLCLYLNSTIGRRELFKSMKSTAQPSLSMTSIREVWVALPPIEEQSRIVCKVSELLKLCEQLQTSIKDGQTDQLHLTDAIVEKAL